MYVQYRHTVYSHNGPRFKFFPPNIHVGPSGRKSGYSKPFENLTSAELKEELQAHQVYDFGTRKTELTKSLKSLLCGIQRVPSLLLLNPTQNLADTNLGDYTVLDCEPLHDLKGHIQNLLDELPSKLNKQLEMEVKQLIATDLSKDMKTGGDYRLTAVHLLTLLRKRDTPPKVLQLLESLVEISSILYAEESKRSPKLILRF